MKESAKNDGCLRNGFITEERPTHAYGDESQALLPWHDVELPKKTKKTSGGEGKGKGNGTRKCSNCGECGHNKKTCPLLKCETVEKKDEKKVQKKVEKVEQVEDVVSTVRAALSEVVAKVEYDEPVQEDDGAGVGLHLIEPQKDPWGAEEQEEVFGLEKDYQVNATGNSTPNTEPLSDPVPELDEDDSSYGDTITFQGIEYTLDTEENMVYDDELSEVGTWDGTKIEFANATAAKLHRVRKLGIKKD
jgi:hypothetical protein